MQRQDNTEQQDVSSDNTETQGYSTHDEKCRMRLMNRILRAESEIEAKSYRSFTDFSQEIRKEFHLDPPY